MASTNKTKNLQLSQFLGSDKPTWLTDYNGDMEKIDNGYGNIINSQTNNESSINSLNDEVNNLKQTDESLRADITKNQTELIVQGGTIETMNHKVTLNQENISQLSTQVSKNSNDIVTINQEIEDLKTGESGVTKTYVDVEVGKVNTAVNNLSASTNQQVARIDSSAGGINLKLNAEGNLVFTDFAGADSVIPFSNQYDFANPDKMYYVSSGNLGPYPLVEANKLLAIFFVTVHNDPNPYPTQTQWLTRNNPIVTMSDNNNIHVLSTNFITSAAKAIHGMVWFYELNNTTINDSIAMASAQGLSSTTGCFLLFKAKGNIPNVNYENPDLHT